MTLGRGAPASPKTSEDGAVTLESPGADERLLSLQGKLLLATRDWSRGEPLDEDIDRIRAEALELCHRRYMEHVPLYGDLARSEGVAEDAALPEVVEQLLFRELFKTYDMEWLRTGDFGAMTSWLAEVSTMRPEARGATTLAAWREELARQGVFLMFSTGTSGKMSFVPRDKTTWLAWRMNSASYARGAWAARMGGGNGGFNLLVAGPKGGGMGILGAGVGLSKMATRAHFLQDRPMEDAVVAELWRDDGTGTPHAPATPSECAEAAAFGRQSAEDGRPLLVFGAPFQVRWLCEAFVASGERLKAPVESMVITGGGWKAFDGQRLSRSALHELLEKSLGISASSCVDSFATTELNCVLSTCSRHRYHVPPLVEPVVLDDSFLGAPGVEGFGQLAFLDPFADSYPGFLITGDQALLRRDACPCGLHGWFLDGEIGRAPGVELKGCGGVLASAVV